MIPISADTPNLSERIVTAATGLFRKRGFKGTTISDISHTCRISRKTLYDVFASKEDIANVVVWRELSALAGEINGDDPGIAPEIRLMELCRQIFAGMAKSSDDTFFWALFSSDPVLELAAYDTLGAVFGGLHEKGCAEGVFKPVDTALAADFIIACIKAARTCDGPIDDRYQLYNESLVMIAGGVIDPQVTIEFRGFRKDYYQFLGAPADSNPDEIKQAFRSFVKQYHPDSNRSGDDQIAKYHDIRKAYEILSNPLSRLQYDEFMMAPLSTRTADFSYDFTPR